MTAQRHGGCCCRASRGRGAYVTLNRTAGVAARKSVHSPRGGLRVGAAVALVGPSVTTSVAIVRGHSTGS